MIMIGCKVKRRNFSFFGLVGRILQLLNEVLDNIKVAVLNSRKEGRISLLVLGGVTHSNRLYEMLDDVKIASSNSKVKRQLSLGFFDGVK